MMTARERMLTAMRNRQPDRVPVAPDMSNMIPCRLTGKAFWDIYLYQDPPLWQAYGDAVAHFGIDGWQPAVPVETESERRRREAGPAWREAIVQRTPERIYTRLHARVDGREDWTPWCNVYYIADPPTHAVALEKVGLSGDAPRSWEDVEPRRRYAGAEAYHAARAQMGDRGVVGMAVGLPGLGRDTDKIMEYMQNPDKVIAECEAVHEAVVTRVRELVELAPDFILIGISGFMIWNPEPIFRRLALPTLQAVTRLCKDAGVPTQIHCCGPERKLVRIAAEESDLTSINPLEIPPMGDCDLAAIKKAYGSRLSLMGNLHTTDVMLRGTPDDVERAARRAIDDAAEGGGFILSTG
ncbi:MAG: hypothetical protein M1457_12460, partial [bacterium]|nr:hypothetical protein [bacterium]